MASFPFARSPHRNPQPTSPDALWSRSMGGRDNVMAVTAWQHQVRINSIREPPRRECVRKQRVNNQSANWGQAILIQVSRAIRVPPIFWVAGEAEGWCGRNAEKSPGAAAKNVPYAVNGDVRTRRT